MKTTANKLKSTASSWQQKFQIQNTFKRNRRYLNISKINQIQGSYSVNRRKPLSNQNIQVNKKINQSFLSSSEVVVSKLDEQIDKFKERISLAHESSNLRMSGNTRAISSARTHQQIQRVPMDLNLPREYYYKDRNKNNNDERLFSNYVLVQPDESHTIDFSQMSHRNTNTVNNSSNDLYYNTQQTYQKYYYKKNTLDLQFSYHAHDKDNGERVYFKRRREDDEPSTDLSPQAIKNAEESIKNNTNNKICCFYNDTAKQLPCQLDMRKNTPLTDYYHSKTGRIQRQQLEYNVRKLKQDLKTQRKNAIKKRKEPKLNRNQLCDLKYFRINKQI